MRQKKFVQIVAVVLALVLLLTLVLSVLSYVALAAPSQEEIDALKAESEKLERKKAEAESQINSLEYEQMSYLAKKEVLDEQVILTEAEITNINEQIAVYDNLIVEKEAEVIDAQKKEDRQLELYKLRVRAMEENGKISYLAVIFDASNFADLLARLDFVHEVMKYDDETYDNYVNAKQETVAAKEGLEVARTEQQSARDELEVKKNELLDKVEEAQNYLIEIESSLESYEAYCAELDAAQVELEKEIKEKTAELERINQQKMLTGSGSFIWPAPGSNVITSVFGTRLHPIYNYYRTHYGIDIGAYYGSNVLASDRGTVTTSAYHWSYGNYIVVNHGNGYATLYAHLSSRLVSAGDEVSQGDVIGLVGSTGDSTGPHLHFEIRENGTCINPLDYFSGYVISE